ncbi:MAG: amino acid-binding protein [Thermodesulfobacteriota bacterium]|nr:amino acid-binding protein [Thermodesulfobacteriota bacterium]
MDKGSGRLKTILNGEGYMFVKQISVSLENMPGKLLEISECLGGEGINIRAISVADTSDISTVRFVSDDPERTINVLKSHGYSVKETDVIAVETPDHPGGLRAVLKPLKEADINVLYLYPYLGRGESGQPIIIVGVNKTDRATEVLRKNWVHTFGKEIYAL